MKPHFAELIEQGHTALPTSYVPSDAASEVGRGERAAALVAYLHSMREMADAQRQVMLRFLGDARDEVVARAGNDNVPFVVAPPSSADRVGAPSRTSSRPPPTPRRATRTTRPPPPPPSSDLTPLAALIATVSERTGYPTSMLDLDMDLEADLGIDSIKRIEILGQLRDRLGLKGMNDAARSEALEELSRYRTLRKIAAWLDAKAAAATPSSGVRLGRSADVASDVAAGEAASG